MSQDLTEDSLRVDEEETPTIALSEAVAASDKDSITA
jgi:hypothetical protein